MGRFLKFCLEKVSFLWTDRDSPLKDHATSSAGELAWPSSDNFVTVRNSPLNSHSVHDAMRPAPQRRGAVCVTSKTLNFYFRKGAGDLYFELYH